MHKEMPESVQFVDRVWIVNREDGTHMELPIPPNFLYAVEPERMREDYTPGPQIPSSL